VPLQLFDTDLHGRTVIGSDGLAIGELSACFIDSETWRVASLQVKLRRDVADRLGAGRNLFHAAAVEIPIRLVQSVGDAILLAVPVDELRQVLPSAAVTAPVH
jgi:sporulation protein YlmC with PRC-barrel domain